MGRGTLRGKCPWVKITILAEHNINQKEKLNFCSYADFFLLPKPLLNKYFTADLSIRN